MLFKQLLVTGDSLHIMALTSGFSETTLTTLSFDVNTARPLGDFTQIPSSIANPSDAHLAATSVEGPARVLWLEHGRIRSAYLSAAGLLGNVKDLLPGKGAKFASILDVRTRQRGFILGKKGNGAVQIIDVRNGAKIVDEFESSVSLPRIVLGLLTSRSMTPMTSRRLSTPPGCRKLESPSTASTGHSA